LKVDFALLSLSGQHKYELIRHFLRVPGFDQAGGWSAKGTRRLGLGDRGLDGSPASLHQVVLLLLQTAGK
jgi:hypothetical protein